MLEKPDDSQFLCQNTFELMGMLAFVKGAKSVLEIGSRYGQTLLHLVEAAPDARIVTLDIGDCPDKLTQKGIQTHLWWDEACNELKKNHELHQIYGDSHDPAIVEKVRALGPYDFVMIDGDHSLEGCKADWDNYGPMGRMVAFHDIRTLPYIRMVFDVARFDRPSIELNAMGGFGIGIVYNG